MMPTGLGTPPAGPATDARDVGTNDRNDRWGRDFNPDRLALLELRMWKAYYRRQPARLLGLLILANREQARVGWPRASWPRSG